MDGSLGAAATRARGAGSAASALLDLRISELDRALRAFERATLYAEANEAYRARFVEPFSFAYRSGGCCYVGEVLPEVVFDVALWLRAWFGVDVDVD